MSELASSPSSTSSELASSPSSTSSELASSPSSTSSERVLVYTRAGCHLCAEAEAEVARICADLGLGFSTADVDTDPELRAEYGDRVPVIMVDGREHGFFRVEEKRLRAALT